MTVYYDMFLCHFLQCLIHVVMDMNVTQTRCGEKLSYQVFNISVGFGLGLVPLFLFMFHSAIVIIL